MSKKTLEKYKPAPLSTISPVREKIIHVPAAQQLDRPRLAVPLMIFAIASALFLLAYAGPSIGILLAYLVIPAAGVFPGLLVWERFGKVAGMLAALLIVAVLTPAYGSAVVDNSVLLFTSLQVISRGILVLLGIMCLGLGLLFLGLQKK